MLRFRLGVLIGLAVMGAVAHAGVTVKFVEPEKFSDIKGNTGFDDREVLKDIEAHLVEQAGRRLPGADLSIEVTDVDLAGDVRPFGRHMQWMRVIRAIDSPALDLRYELREAGKVVRAGTAHLRDVAFQDRINAYSSGDPLRYERRMIDKWLDEEFGHPAPGAARN